MKETKNFLAGEATEFTIPHLTHVLLLQVQEEHLRGPLTFPLERLMAIFKSVAGEYLHRPTTEQGVEEPGHVHRQLTTLVGVGLVSKAGGDPMEGGAKYRCNASRELADKVRVFVSERAKQSYCDFGPSAQNGSWAN
jgi:hypothetical protein